MALSLHICPISAVYRADHVTTCSSIESIDSRIVSVDSQIVMARSKAVIHGRQLFYAVSIRSTAQIGIVALPMCKI